MEADWADRWQSSSKLERLRKATVQPSENENELLATPAIQPDPTGQAPVQPAPQGTGGIWRSRTRDWSLDLLIAFAISAFIIFFLYQPVHVEGTSMLPMLEDKDLLFVNKFVYRFEAIQRGDVVVFLYPHDHTKSYIKRVIALPGDDLRIDHGKVWVNGHLLPEPYVPRRFQDDRSQPEMVVPAGEYFVMGDHRSISSDSRDFGTVAAPLIYGKAAFVYWPVDQAGVVH
jgi:signal peptidase I